MSEKQFRLWENLAINDALKHALQIKENIEHLAVDSNTHIKDLPQSLVPTSFLYNLVSCYEILYHVGLEEQLIKTGNLRTDRNNTH